MIGCVICGGLFEKRRHGPSKYCSAECRRVFELREHHRKRAERGLPKLGDRITCERCGMVTNRRSRSGPVYCSQCSEIRRAETSRTWREQNHQVLMDRSRKRDKVPRHNLDKRMKWGIWAALKGRKDGRRWEALIGYTLDDLIRHIERQFTGRMTWQNMGRWHIDHIIPKSAFSYETPDDPAFKACWALSNLRPLWGRDNIRKSAKRTHLL